MKNVFFSLWLKLSSLVLISLIPMSFLLMNISKEASQSFDFETEAVIEKLTKYESMLKEENKRGLDNEHKLKEEFMNSMELRHKLEDQRHFTSLFYERIRSQSLGWLFLVASLSLLLSAFLSISIKRQFQKLFLENIKNREKISSLRQLESWQRALRILVHEIRGPLTPLKLTLSSLKEKAQTIHQNSIETIKDHFIKGSQFSLDQIGYVERLMQSFTSFTRLPEPQRKKESIHLLINEFTKITNDVYGISIDFKTNEVNKDSDLLFLDRDLIKTVLSNLIKNAKEAGATSFSVVLGSVEGSLLIDIQNNGPAIPADRVERLFEFGYSSKSSQDQNNFGVGLTVCKKIILDHEGELLLHSNDVNQGVTFRILLPIQGEKT